MFQLNEPISLGQRVNLAALYYAASAGIGLILLSAGLSHLTGGPMTGSFFMMVSYGGLMFTMRGWREFCALLAMLGTFVAYFAAWEAFRLGSSLIVSIVLSVLVVGLYVVYILWMVDMTTKIRAVSLGRTGTISTREAMSLPLQDTEQRVLERADAARLVIMVCDATPGMKWEIENVPQRVGFKRIVLVLPFCEDEDAKRSPEWYKRWATLREKFTFLPEVSEDTIAVLFNEDDLPIVVSSNGASLQKRIAVIKDAWLKNAQ